MRGVDAVGEDGRAIAVDAPLVVVAAGALRTPGILARSGVQSAHLGRHLHLHPTTALSAEFDAPVEPWLGPMQTALCDRFSASRGRFRRDDRGGAVASRSDGARLPWSGREAHASEMSGARNRAVLISLTRDRGEGSVGLDDRADVTYKIAPDDARRMATGLAGAARIAFAAGAASVATLHADPLRLTAAEATPAGLDAFARALAQRAASRAPVALFSAHQMGTARMGATAERRRDRPRRPGLRRRRAAGRRRVGVSERVRREPDADDHGARASRDERAHRTACSDRRRAIR